MTKHDAPQIGEVAVISKLVTPTLHLDIQQVLAHDTEHNAWQVAACVNPHRFDRGVIPSTDATFWVKLQRHEWPNVESSRWELYDINSPLAAREPL